MEQKNGFGLSFEKRKHTVEKILKIANGQPYNMVFKGPGSEFESSTMNYEYLAWWIAKNPPSKVKQNLGFIIEEKQNLIDVKIR